MTIGFITTSRADFGIYIPLLNRIKNSEKHDYRIFAGGMHTSERFGNSYHLIEEQGFEVHEKLDSLVDDDSPHGISESMALTSRAYAQVWKKYGKSLDMVFVLGDRFEMLAATASLVPFNIPIAHLHGGETTLGAIDNKFRHAITAMSDYHFTSHATHSERVLAIVQSDDHIHNVGALAIENMQDFETYSPTDFKGRFQFDLDTPFILTTYHPETKALKNKEKIESLLRALDEIPEVVLCTLPNADTEGSLVREAFLEYEKRQPEKIKCFENLGQTGYITAMKHCKYMLGNTSSGIIEAASFNKPVINVGDRQKGRLCGENVIHVDNDSDSILQGVKKTETLKDREFINPYGDGRTSQRIIDILDKL